MTGQSAHKMPLRDKITLALLVLMSIFLMCDLYITAGLVNELAREWDVEKKFIGFVGSAFTLVGAFISIFFGYFTDKADRKKLLVATVIIGEIPCLLCGIPAFTQTYTSFLILRILTGIGIGGIYPLTFSLISDYFTSRHRAHATAWIEVAWGIGMMGGPLLAAFAAGTVYGWRLAFLLAAVPNFLVVIFFALYAQEPERGQTEDALTDLIDSGAHYKNRIKLSDFKIILNNKTNLLLFLQGIPGCIPWGILPFWIISYFETERGMPKGDAAMIWEIFGIATTVGALIWAIVGDKVFNRNPRYLPLMCGTGVLLGIIPTYFLINAPAEMYMAKGIMTFYLLAFLAGFIVSIAGSNNKAVIMNVNRPEHRGSVFAMFNIADSIGKGIGPALGGILLSSGYLFMMNFAISWWAICGVILLLIYFTIGKDRKALLDLMDERADSLSKTSQ